MCHTEKALKSSPLLSLLGDTSMVLELLTGGTRFPKEQQEMLQSSCPPPFSYTPPPPETCMNHQSDQSCQNLLGDMLTWACLCMVT